MACRAGPAAAAPNKISREGAAKNVLPHCPGAAGLTTAPRRSKGALGARPGTGLFELAAAHHDRDFK